MVSLKHKLLLVVDADTTFSGFRIFDLLNNLVAESLSSSNSPVILEFFLLNNFR